MTKVSKMRAEHRAGDVEKLWTGTYGAYGFYNSDWAVGRWSAWTRGQIGLFGASQKCLSLTVFYAMQWMRLDKMSDCQSRSVQRRDRTATCNCVQGCWCNYRWLEWSCLPCSKVVHDTFLNKPVALPERLQMFFWHEAASLSNSVDEVTYDAVTSL